MFFHSAKGDRCFFQIGFCPWCGRDLNLLVSLEENLE